MDGKEAAAERILLTWDEGGEASQSDHCPKVIPPEHALPDTKGDPSNGDKAREEEKGQRGIYGAQSRYEQNTKRNGTRTLEISQGGGHRRERGGME